jgi:hypothetical protein
LTWASKPPFEWLEARRLWNREVRDFIKRGTPGLDSPGLYESAVKRLDIRSVHYAHWQSVKDTYVPRTKPQWIDSFLAEDAAIWASENTGVVWVKHPTFGERIAELSGLPFFGEGDEAAEAILNEKGDRSIICSMEAHGTGRNLQIFSKALVTHTSSNGARWEQLLGRLHRQGQQADEVDYYIYQHTAECREAFDAAVTNAAYIGKQFAQEQRLTYATKDTSIVVTSNSAGTK